MSTAPLAAALLLFSLTPEAPRADDAPEEAANVPSGIAAPSSEPEAGTIPPSETVTVYLHGPFIHLSASGKQRPLILDADEASLSTALEKAGGVPRFGRDDVLIITGHGETYARRRLSQTAFYQNIADYRLPHGAHLVIAWADLGGYTDATYAEVLAAQQAYLTRRATGEVELRPLSVLTPEATGEPLPPPPPEEPEPTATAYCHGQFNHPGPTTLPASQLTLGRVLQGAEGIVRLSPGALKIRLVNEDKRTTVISVSLSELYATNDDYLLPDGTHIVAPETFATGSENLQTLQTAYFQRLDAGLLTVHPLSDYRASGSQP
jgi:hypothetical protein